MLLEVLLRGLRRLQDLGLLHVPGSWTGKGDRQASDAVDEGQQVKAFGASCHSQTAAELHHVQEILNSSPGV